jgi:hypothetical protein
MRISFQFCENWKEMERNKEKWLALCEDITNGDVHL